MWLEINSHYLNLDKVRYINLVYYGPHYQVTFIFDDYKDGLTFLLPEEDTKTAAKALKLVDGFVDNQVKHY